MLISIIIPAFGREELLVRCLSSLNRNIQGDLDYEVCVVDDGSGLDEVNVREKAAVNFPLIWRSFKSSRGRSAARNEGIRSTSGIILVFLDSDMEAREDFINTHFKYHSTNPRIAVIGKILWPEGGSFLRYISSRGVAKLKPDEKVPPWYFVTGNASVKRQDLPSDGVFDETLPGWGGEDLDLGMKLHLSGVEFMYAPEAVSFHHFVGDLAGHIKRTALYGKSVLPVLVERYPELEKILRLDLLNSFVLRLAVHNLFFIPAFWTIRILDSFPFPAYIYDYLTYSAYAGGWLKRERL
ncbi:MAG: glycosyltransferase [Candidatus Latescibacteria bacterium]|jgi:glycosyltransferase involved in cell wall biosynthesis|nr:glycosyltransferase [Candidatus Latescibacterota bacterium]